MNSVSVDVSLDQLKKALRQLPNHEKIALWRLLDKELDRSAIARQFSASVNTIRKAYTHIPEGEVMKDAIKATRRVRKARNAKSRS